MNILPLFIQGSMYGSEVPMPNREKHRVAGCLCMEWIEYWYQVLQ